MYSGCDESLMGVDPSKIHPTGYTLVQGECDESLEGVDPPRIHRMGCTIL